MDISVTIAVKNEGKIIPLLVEKLISNLEKQNKIFEIIFITDYNNDETEKIVEKINSTDKRVKLIKLSSSLGQAQGVALFAGLEHCKGEVAVLMDGDMQANPDDLCKLFDEYNNGYDIVYATYKEKNESKIRNLFSRSFTGILAKFADYKFNSSIGTYMIISRKLIDEIIKHRDPLIRFVIGLINLPSKAVELPSGHRHSGKSNYNYIRQIALAVDSIISYSTKPLIILSLGGMLISMLSILYFLIVIIQFLIYGTNFTGWYTIVILITFLGGAQLFGLGIIGQYIGKIFNNSKNRPMYTIDYTIGDLK
jgi:dolichol-phosphate mannosyltransferase